jgi:catechol 2,3-dioxygenase-like lactoylglutathione lyase family enzyme
MLDHIGFGVSDYERATEFYTRALAPLGITPVFEVTPEETGGAAHMGYGSGSRPYFWIGTIQPAGATHVAFAADTRERVDRFYQAAIAAGGRDNGPPGLRPHYHPDYYGAFVLDPDGNNIEAVCHHPA